MIIIVLQFSTDLRCLEPSATHYCGNCIYFQRCFGGKKVIICRSNAAFFFARHKIFDAANVVVNIQHWHSVEVLALSYTPRGSTILSGGHECVLVQWQEDGKHFLPRLGAPIEKIAVSDDNVLYACCHADNCKFRFVSASR